MAVMWWCLKLKCKKITNKIGLLAFICLQLKNQGFQGLGFPNQGFRVLEFRIIGFRVLRFRVQGFTVKGFRVIGFKVLIKVQGLGFKGFGFGVDVFGFKGNYLYGRVLGLQISFNCTNHLLLPLGNIHTLRTHYKMLHVVGLLFVFKEYSYNWRGI